MVTKVFIVIASLILHLGCRVVKYGTSKSDRKISENNGDVTEIHTSVSTTTEKNEEESDDVEDKEEKSTTLQTSKNMTTKEAIPSSSSPTDEDEKNTNRKGKRQVIDYKRAWKHETSTTSQMSVEMQTAEKIQSSSFPNARDKENAKRLDYSYTESGKIGLTLAVALILVAFCVGAVVMAVILCCTQEKWTSRIPNQRTHHYSKTSTERSDAVIVMADVYIQTGGSVDVDPSYNEILSANNVPVHLGDEHLELRVPSEPNDYEIVLEHGYRRSSLEHPYGCLSAVGDVNPIAHNEMEHNETINKEGEHDYFVLPLNEDDGKNATEGSEMKIGETNHDYFVLASRERDRENLTEENKMEKGENNHDYFVLASHERDGEMPLKKIN